MPNAKSLQLQHHTYNRVGRGGGHRWALGNYSNNCYYLNQLKADSINPATLLTAEFLPQHRVISKMREANETEVRKRVRCVAKVCKSVPIQDVSNHCRTPGVGE